MNIQPRKSLQVLLIGDVCEDVYEYGTVTRISPEAPVPVFSHSHSMSKTGMVGNVNENFMALDCAVTLITGTETSRKTRLIDSRSQQHVLRIDLDRQSQPVTKKQIAMHADKNFDLIAVSDYGKGTVDLSLISVLTGFFSCPIFIDSKNPYIRSQPQVFVKINAQEYQSLIRPDSDMIVTLGSGGCRYKNRVYPAVPTDVVDIVGAGDTFLAAVSWEFVQTGSMDRAIEFANRAAAITVKRPGVYAPTLEEICA